MNAMLKELKREAKDWLIVGAILGAVVLFAALILGSIAFEVLKGWALIKFIFFW